MMDASKEVVVRGKKVKGRDLKLDVRIARKALQDDLIRRWVTELSEDGEASTVAARVKVTRKNERLRRFMISTLLDPRFKNWDFKGAHHWFKEKAMKFLKEEYLGNWAPTMQPPAPSPEQGAPGAYSCDTK